jgi:cellulose synthase/poly-beta-1,6-N-acetylglucosamine synthase-like glycosyltransferase
MTLLVGIVLAAITALYVAAVVSRLLIVFAGAAPASAGAALIPAQGPRFAADRELPVYTVLVPLDGPARGGPAEGNDAVGDLVDSLSALDYPATRLQVMLLAGDDDWGMLDGVRLPDHFDVVETGQASSMGKLATGLAMARGELCVSYQPGQFPDPGQVRAAAAAFSRLPAWVVCLRPESRPVGPYPTWLAQCAAADSTVTGALLPRGLDRFRLPVPADGPSGHFRTDALRHLGPWGDGAREDGTLASISMLIARRGWSTRMLASVTSERGDSRPGPWIRRRAAATRTGYLACAAAVRRPLRLLRDLSPAHFTTIQLTTAAATFTALANPLFWLLTVAWLAAGGHLAGVVPVPVAVAAVAAVVLGNLVTAYSLMAGCMEQGLFRAVRTMLLAPAYWALASVAAYRALLPGPEQQQSARSAAPVTAA